MQRKKFDATTKAKVALEAAKGLRTANEIAGEYHCEQSAHSAERMGLNPRIRSGVSALLGARRATVAPFSLSLSACASIPLAA
jgi:hypothetical protein